MKNIKLIIVLALTGLSILILIGCVIASVVFSIQNPDMTQMRRLMEYPEPCIVSCIAVVMVWIANKLID